MKTKPREKGAPRGVIFTRPHVSLALLSLWAKEKTGAREGDTRVLRLSFSRARFFFFSFKRHYSQPPATQAIIEASRG